MRGAHPDPVAPGPELHERDDGRVRGLEPGLGVLRVPREAHAVEPVGRAHPPRPREHERCAREGAGEHAATAEVRHGELAEPITPRPCRGGDRGGRVGRGARGARRARSLDPARSGAPLVLGTTGYALWLPYQYLDEPTTLLDANQLLVEERYFSPSRPEPADWSKLDIRQAAADHHRSVEAFRPLYPAAWISEGVPELRGASASSSMAPCNVV
ncbi:MAG: hypothetical protein IT373_25310 [Polyangiaceae bacterium]|nr:hypothetical protein [Polyangiaceae bacterium]